MSSAARSSTAPAAAGELGQSTQAVTHAPAAAPIFVKGRRAFFQYRDLGVTQASGGQMRAQVTIGTEGLTRPTGWHYHVCDGQFIYMLKGWVELQFADRTIRVEAGDSLYIPGGVHHNETSASAELEILEVSVPADMGTKPCAAPAGLAD
jgi:mannose-6-phosphate isomerase-like protein (cupin superfamily)